MQRNPEEQLPAGYSLVREQWVAQPLETVFAFFSQAANLEQLTPPWLRFQIVTPQPVMMDVGTKIEYRVHWHRVPIGWLTEIIDWQPPVRFVDLQLRGPYAYWHHTHLFEPIGRGTRIRDIVRYRLPLGILGNLAHRLAVRRDVQAIFDYREQRVDELFASIPAKTHSDAAASGQDPWAVDRQKSGSSREFPWQRGNHLPGP